MQNSTLLSNDSYTLEAAHWLAEITLIAAIDGSTTPLDFSSQISEFGLIAKFDEHQMPYFMVSLDLSRLELVSLQDNAVTTRFVLSILMVEESDSDDLSPRNEFQFCKDLVCKPLDFDKFSVLEEEGVEIGVALDTWRTEVIFFAEDHLRLNSKVSQLIVSNSTVEGAIIALVQKFGTLSLMLSKPENSKTYRNIIVPPGNLTQSLYYLQDYYGIYNSGLKLFSDFEKTMIMPFNKFNQRTGSPEKLIIEVYDTNQSDALGNRPVITSADLSEVIMRVPSGAVDHKVNPIKEMHTVGDRVSYKSADNTSHEIKVAQLGGGGIEVPKLQTTRQLTNTTSNPFATSDHIRKTNEAVETVTVAIPDAFISALDVDTKVQLIYKSVQANSLSGNFRIKDLFVYFPKVSKLTNKSSSSVITLVKI